MEETVSKVTSNGEEIITESSKHWSSYIVLIIITLAGISVFSSELWLLGIPILLYSITLILSNLRTKWELTNQYLHFTTGFLPWKRTDIAIPHSLFFEAYYERNFFSVILGFGNLVLKKTDGNTSFLRTTMMNNKKEIIQNINGFAWQDNNEQPIINQQINTSSVSDELLKLSNLRDQGILTEEEFQEQKQRLLNS